MTVFTPVTTGNDRTVETVRLRRTFLRTKGALVFYWRSEFCARTYATEGQGFHRATNNGRSDTCDGAARNRLRLNGLAVARGVQDQSIHTKAGSPSRSRSRS